MEKIYSLERKLIFILQWFQNITIDYKNMPKHKRFNIFVSYHK